MAVQDETSQQTGRIVHEDTTSHTPRDGASRPFIQERVEGRGLDPRTVADRQDSDVADVYRTVAYYHDHPEEMQTMEERRRAIENAGEVTTDPDDVRG